MLKVFNSMKKMFVYASRFFLISQDAGRECLRLTRQFAVAWVANSSRKYK